MAGENVPERVPGAEDGTDRGQGARREEVLRGNDMIFAEAKRPRPCTKSY